MGSPSLPSGLTLSATGVISGIPTTTTPVGAPVNLIVQVLDSGSAAQGSQQTATKTLSITVDPAPIPLQIVTNALPPGTINVAYFAALSGNGGTTPYTWGLQTGSPPLPPGLTLDTANGLIQGTPTQTANTTLIITLHDAKLTVVQKSLTLTISAVPLLITTTSLPQGGALQPYSFQLVASGGTGPGTYTWTLTDPGNFPLPIGLMLDSSGLLHGVPTVSASGTYTLKFTVTDQTLPSPESKSTTLNLLVN